jgi:hypothetical protein
LTLNSWIDLLETFCDKTLGKNASNEAGFRRTGQQCGKNSKWEFEKSLRKMIKKILFRRWPTTGRPIRMNPLPIQAFFIATQLFVKVTTPTTVFYHTQKSSIMNAA